MRVVILHNELTQGASSAEEDVLVQVDAVVRALTQLGHEPLVLACSLDLKALLTQLQQLNPQVVFNLVESLGGTDQLAYLVPALLEAFSWPFTGSSALSLFTTNHKLRSKSRLREAGLPTPDWLATSAQNGSDTANKPITGRYIVKCIGEHASLGLDDQAIVSVETPHELARALSARERQIGRPCFAERYIEGREINIALLEDEGMPQVLAPAEILFDTFPPAKPRIVGYAAKWDEGSFEYRETPRRLTFPESDGPLLDQLNKLARRCWSLFELRGYARVDFRVDTQGHPFILEINANPCLSPDAGFAAALTQDGLTLDRAIARIFDSAFARASAHG